MLFWDLQVNTELNNMIKLKSFLQEEEAGALAAGKPAAQPATPMPKQPAEQPTATPAGQDSSTEYSPSFDFTDFERKIAQSTESARNTLQEKLLSKIGNKKVLIRASKGQPAQPKKDITINVSGVSVDYYYDKYVVVLKDEKEKEYFLDTSMKIKILGPAEASKALNKKDTQPVAPKQVAVAPVEKTPNTATQGI